MLFLKILFIILLSIVFIAALLYVLYVLVRKGRYNRALEQRLSPIAYFHETVCSEFFRRNIFTGFFYPSAKDKHGIIRNYTKIDSVVITKGGVAVVSVCDRHGRIDNSRQTVWAQCVNDDVREFDNPETRNEINRKIISEILRENKLRNVPVYNVIVFTDKNTELLVENGNVLLLDDFIPMIKQMNFENALTLFEMFNVRQVLDSAKRRSSEVKAYMNKLNAQTARFNGEKI